MLGKGYLCAVVTQDAWQTPTTNMDMVRSEEGVQKRIAFRASIGRKSIPDGNLGEQMQRLHGQAAPANPSTDGSRPESWVDWRTPQANEAGARVETLYTKDGQPARPGERAYRKTPDGRMVLQSQTINQQVEMVQNWATPNAFCYQPPENTEQWTKRAEYQQTEKGVNLHKPVQSQVLHENEKAMGAMPPSAGKLNPRWVESLQGVCMGWTSPSCPASVIKNWPKFVSGWCAVTIEPTNYDSSATESCLPQPSELFAF
jgi:hypothetical protein